jgi:hypothetical protein
LLLLFAGLSFMPRAAVNGTVVFRNQTYTLNTFMYHDSNWGAWPGPAFKWVWSQFSSDDPTAPLAFVLGAYRVPLTQDYIGYLFLRFKGQRFKIGTLCGDHFALRSLSRARLGPYEYSTSNAVVVESTQWLVSVNYTAERSALNDGGFGLGLAVFEQLSLYSVALYQRAPNNSWQLVLATSGPGFSEWSDHLFFEDQRWLSGNVP